MGTSDRRSRVPPARPGRRELLAALGAGAVSLSSGCAGLIGGDATPRPKLGWVVVKNYHSAPQRFEVRIERGDALVHESEHEVDGKPPGRIPGDVLECTWGSDPGSYVLRGRVADSEWVERSVARVIDESESMDGTEECVIAEGAYGKYGSPRFGWLVQDWCGEVPTYEGGCAFANSDA
jgi:hypothetical protein